MSARLSRSLVAPLCIVALSWGQTPVPLGKGSYASTPPSQAGAAVDSFERLSRLDVKDGETRAIPTNDWWTDVLVSPFGGDLWAHPLVVDPDDKGARIWYPTTQAADGNGMQRGDAIHVGGEGFAPTRDLAQDWGDWHVVVRLEAGASHMDMTLARGVPVAWFEVAGIQPRLELPAGMTAATASGATITATATTLDRLVLTQGAKAFGVHLPAGSSASFATGVLSLTLPVGSGWFALSGLPAAKDLDSWQEWATVVPRETKLAWTRMAPSGMRVAYSAIGQDLSGKGRSAILQTFPPHAWRNAKSAPTWHGETWSSSRGTLKAALGSSFVFEYDMPGILPDYGAAEADPTGTANPWNQATQDAMVSAYLAKATYGADTYWGGKDLVLLAKHATFATRTGHPDAKALLAKAEQALADWLTWDPGETAHYFAWYPRWKALVGFQESYGSSQFTDNHFHYGYLIHAAALVGSIDPRFLADYGPMLRKVAKQYANWDRQDSSLPFLRTFEPWTGHSYAGGTSSPGGNNQESTSEAMQSWIGLFLLGSTMGDTAMRDAGSFGYLMESRATMEYWFDWKRENFAPGWAHSNVGIVFDGGQSYGTWFSANPLHIHGIQYLPVCPAFQYLARDTAWARSEYAAMRTEAAASEGYTDETMYGDDWANVAFGFEQLFDPGEVCRRFDADRAAGKGWTSEINATATYVYAHANRQLGAVAWDYSYSLPSAMGFRKGGRITHVVWNPSTQEVACDVFRDGAKVGTIRIPARTVVRHRIDAGLASLAIVTPGRTLSSDVPTRLSVRGIDQYGATIDAGAIQWSATSGTIDGTGLFTAAGLSDSVTITASASGLSTSIVVRTGALPRLSTIELRPAYVQMLQNGSRELLIRGKDQYGDPIALSGIQWTAHGPLAVANGVVSATGTGTGWIAASSGGVSDSIPVDVYARMLDLSTGAKVVASSTLGANVPEGVLDGDGKTRWESEHGIDTVWLRIELDTIRELSSTVLEWENAAAAKYQVQVSDDGIVWRTWTSVTGGDGGLDSLAGSGRGRFVRVFNTARTTDYGYSLWETRLWGFPRTAFSALLDADTGSWTESVTKISRRDAASAWRSVRIGDRSFRVALSPDETILSADLVDLRGRTISARRSSRGMAILRLRTDRGERARPVLIADGN